MMFSDFTVGKIRRLRRDPRAAVLVADGVGVPEAWVSVEGVVELSEDGARELAEKLAARYYEPDQAKAFIKQTAQTEQVALLSLTPTLIRSIWGNWVKE